jgi:6-phosphogluconolactonase
MKFSQLGRLALASAVSASLVLGMAACGQSNTIDFVYVASANANPGQIYAFAANGQSGVLSQVQGSPFPAGRNPIALARAIRNDGTYIYALNHDDNTVTEYATGSDGKLYSLNTYNVRSGTNPNGLAVSPDQSTLYVVEAYGLDPSGTPFSPTTPGIGALVQFPIGTGGQLGTESSYPTCNNPVAVNVLANGSALYVVNDPSGQLTSLIDTVAAENRGATGSATVIYPAAGACFGGAGAPGQITSYVVNSDNSLSPGAGSPFATGPPNTTTAPNAIASDPASRFLYVTDFLTSQMYSYAIQSNGGLAALNVATSTGQAPSALTIDPSGKFIYAANYNSNTVSGFAIDQTTGVPSPLAGSSNVSGVDTGPAAVLIEDSSGRYMYTANFIAGTVSSLFFDPNAGTTHTGQSSPFPGVAKATAVASVKHNNPTM